MGWVSRRYKNMNYVFDIPDKFLDYDSDGYRNDDGSVSVKATDLITQLFSRCDEMTQLGLREIGVDPTRLSLSIGFIWRYVKYRCDKYDAVNKEFEQYVVDNPWVRDYYQSCVNDGFHYVDPVEDLNLRYHWTHVNTSEGKAKFLTNLNLKNFCYATDRRRLAVYNEMKRPVPFAVGNLVMLKTTFISTQSHDPFYFKSNLKDEARIGIITEVLNETHRNSFNGPGSRLVNVLWSASGEKSAHSIKTLKLLNRKDKIVNRLKERDYDVENPSAES